MLAATHFDNLLVLLFFAAAIIFQILTKAASKGRGRRPPDTGRRSTSPSQISRPLEREEDETDEERIRKFLEALGQPTTSKPPPPAKPRPTYQKPVVLPHVGSFGSPLPPLKTRPADLPPETTPPLPVIPRRELPTARAKVAETSTFEVHAGPPPLVPLTEAETKTAAVAQLTAEPRDLATMLRSTSGLRDAIILREIFGPPRSMQPLDLVGSG